MTNDDFIELLDQQRLAPAGVLRQLRAKAAEGDQRITPKSILKYLVKKEIVSRAQAKELLETTLTVSNKAESSILGLAPLADFPDERSAKPAKTTEPTKAAAKASEPPSGKKPVAKADKPEPTRRSAPPAEEPIVLEPFDETAPRVALGAGGGFDPFAEAAAQGGVLEGETLTEVPGETGKVKKKKKKRSGKLRDKSEWDSPLLLMGGTGLAVLVVAGIILYYLLIRENADAILAEGNKYFEAGNYAQAIGQYERFVEGFPGHPDYSEAKVRLGMSQLWQATERTSNYEGALAVAQKVIAEIEDEPAFTTSEEDDDGGLSEAKRQLSSLLTIIAKGLAEQADAAEDKDVASKRIEQIKTVLALTANTKYVPQRFRMDTELEAVRETLERVELRQQRDADLAAALLKMDEAIGKGETAAAFALRSDLIKQYPVLIEDKSLGEKVLKIAEAERAVVKFVEEPRAAITEAPASPIVAELAMADRRGETGQAGGAVVVRIDGGLYGLKAADGALLWRRFAGLDATSYPLMLANGNVVAEDSQREELVCLHAETGKLVWRQPLEGKLATPGALGDRLLVGSDAGKLFIVEQESGNLLGHVQFTQPIRLPPAVNDRGDRVFVLGEHSNLYTLAADDLSCVGVCYLGHAAGAISAPPLAVLNKVVVADNSGAESCRVRVLSLNEQGAAGAEVASHRMSGLVITPLQSAGRRFAAVTTQGQAAVFEAGAATDKAALTALASREAQDRQQLARFALLHEGHLWVAGRQLAKLEILPTGNQLPVRSLDRDYRRDEFDYPLQAAGNLVIHVRRPAGQAGAKVAAMDATANRAVWETELAVPPAGAPAVDPSGLRITAGTATGAVYMVDRAAMSRRVQDQAERLDLPAAQMPTLTDSLDLGQGRLVLGGVGGVQLLHFRPGNPREQLRAVELAGPLSCPPVAWRNGFVAATTVGQVGLHDADAATPLATPFQPELTPGQEYKWLRPAVAGSGADSQLVISDGVAKVYLVTLKGQPQPHLEAAASVDVGGSPLATPLAVAGSSVFAGNEAGQLASFSLPALKPNEPVALGGRVGWGPHTVGDGVLLAVDSGELFFVGGDGAIRWRQPLKRGELAGMPLVDGENILLLYPSAGVARIALADGAEVGFVELGQPTVAGPVPFGPRLVLSAADGALLVINRP